MISKAEFDMEATSSLMLIDCLSTLAHNQAAYCIPDERVDTHISQARIPRSYVSLFFQRKWTSAKNLISARDISIQSRRSTGA